MNEDTTNAGTGTTSTEGDSTTTGQTNGTTSSGPGDQTQTSQQNNGTQSQGVKTPINTLPPDIQDYIKDLRRKETLANEKVKTEAASKTAAEEAKLLEDGKYKDLLSKRDTEVTTLKNRVAELEKQTLVSKVVAKHKLPDELAKLLTGTTEAELEESAGLLVKHLRPSGVNTEGGRGSGAGAGQNQNRPAGQNQNNTAGGGQQTNKTYSFQRPGEVEWPS